MNERTVDARWYETPTGLLVPIPPISGGGGDVGAPAAPAAPAPAAPAPSAGSAPTPAAPAAPAPVSPAPATSPASPTSDAAGIRSIIDGILSDPRLGPIARERLAPTLGPPGAPPAAPVDSGLQQAWRDYQQAPDDQAAFAHLIHTAVALGEQRTLQTLEGRAIDQANQSRQHQTHVAVAQAVNDAVTKEAPDVDLELFWSFGRRAQEETPRHLTSRSERIEWQKNRAVELARAKQAQIRGGAAASAGVVTPGGRGTAPPAPPGAPGGSKSMIEQVRDLRRSQYSS